MKSKTPIFYLFDVKYALCKPGGLFILTDLALGTFEFKFHVYRVVVGQKAVLFGRKVHVLRQKGKIWVF